MKAIKGHLTSTNKKHIQHLLSLGMMEGKINRTTYFLTKLSEDHFAVEIEAMETRWCETSPKLTRWKHEFIL